MALFYPLARRSETQEAFPHAARLHEAQPPAEWSLKVGDPAVRRFHLLEIKIYMHKTTKNLNFIQTIPGKNCPTITGFLLISSLRDHGRLSFHHTRVPLLLLLCSIGQGGPFEKVGDLVSDLERAGQMEKSYVVITGFKWEIPY